ncbi:aminotransferase class IV [Patulibacter sp. SYSU D01012]|uniref:aminotransferase class IV n=1 Tax=Patulibacter sp. SYSU D01012 TaxID=2817381 RepID=UPI001B303A90
MLVEDGRIRLLDRHLLRLRRSGATGAQVSGVRALAETWRRTAREPTVVRFEVRPGGAVRSIPRAPAGAAPQRLATVAGYDPDDADRERKRADRTWALAAEAAAVAAGADAPLLVAPDGRAGETSRANLFVVAADGSLRTPPAQGLLPGVTRGWVLDVEPGAAEAPVTREDLAGARAAFLTTAGRGIVPVAAIDGRPLGDDPRIAALAARWRALR